MHTYIFANRDFIFYKQSTHKIVMHLSSDNPYQRIQVFSILWLPPSKHHYCGSLRQNISKHFLLLNKFRTLFSLGEDTHFLNYFLLYCCINSFPLQENLLGYYSVIMFLLQCVCVFPHPLHLVGHSDLKQRGEVSQPGTEAVTQDGQLGQEDMERPFLCGDRQQLAVICPAQLVQTWRSERKRWMEEKWVHSRWPFESMARKEDCLTFSLIIQPNYIADVFELRQLVDLYAVTKNMGL